MQTGNSGGFRTYEQLTGAMGRAVVFRPTRRRAESVFGGERLEVRFGESSGRLIDLSHSGACISRLGDVRTGARERLSLRMGETEVYAGAAEVRWVNDSRCGISFCERPLDLDAAARTVAALAVRSRLTTSSERPSRAYLELTGALHYGLKELQARLAPFDDLDGPKDAAALAVRADVKAAALEALIRDFDPIWRECNALTEALQSDPAALAPYKRHAELTLTPELMAGEVWRRAYQKPLGYPGDYQVMVAAYDHDPLRSGHGQGLYGEVLHALMTTHLSVCIQGRSALTRDAILAHAAENPNGGGVYRVANVGAGPAREIEQMLAAPSLPRRMEITLVEQDTEALDYVHGRIFPHLMRHSGQVRLNGLNASFVDLLRGGRLYDALGPQDAIYSLGLIDYFAQTTARRVARGLYEKLKPGGLMVLCNMKQAPHSTYWPLEFLCDWSLVYRNEEQMRDLLRDIPTEHVSIETDPSDRVLVLFARKPL